jgi:hypothetical protein
MPASEEAFTFGTEEVTSSLHDALRAVKPIQSRLGARVLAGSLFFEAVELESQACESQSNDAGNVTED